MKITGIIAEYNPFHNGHGYQLAKARELTGADYLIVVMSGDFVQRGTPAILEKHVRARFALEHGADLVLELPVRFSTASAMDFASGAVEVLDALQAVSFLCFGSESGNLEQLSQAAEILEREPEAYRNTLQAALRQGLSFPAARQRAFGVCLEGLENPCHGKGPSRPAQLAKISGQKDNGIAGLLESPNNILGIEYLRALGRLNSPIRPVTLARTSDNYHSPQLEHQFASATAIRRALAGTHPERIAGFVPEDVLGTLLEAARNSALLWEDDFSLPLKYQLLQCSPETLAGFLDVPRPLANRICRHLDGFTGFGQFAELLKTRETTRTRINRALLHILLQLDREPRPLSYLRILGFRKNSAPLLTYLKERSRLPLISRLTTLPADAIREDLFASNLYHSTLACKTGVPRPDERSHSLVIL